MTPMPILVIIACLLSQTEDSPAAVIRNGSERMQKLLKSPRPTVAGATQITDDYIDFGELGKRALGSTWAKIRANERTEFANSVTGILRWTYADKAVSGGARKIEDIRQVSEQVQGNEATVTTEVVPTSESTPGSVPQKPWPIVYKLYRAANGKWRAYDIIADEVSILDTCRDEFRSIIAKRGFAGLLTSLKDKRERIDRPPTN